MATWKKLITTNDDSSYKNSNVTVSDLGGGSGTTQFLRKDGSWSVPPDTNTDTNTTYSAGSGLTLSGRYDVPWKSLSLILKDEISKVRRCRSILYPVPRNFH